ncbi:MAG: hypothetical protein CMH57_01535 [Myxococcales bacterium]|nr:hypothetical protein [Myxococcales bacterium]
MDPEQQRAPSRRVTRWAALLAVALCALACSEERWQTEEPTEALELFIQAVYVGNTEIAWRLLPPDTQAELTRRADALNAHVTGEAVQPHQLLASSGFLGPHHVVRVQRDKSAASGPEQATLVLTTHPDREHTVRMTRVDQVWRVDVGALPDAAAAKAPPADPGAATSGDTPEGGAPPRQEEAPETP